jgi:HAD superfamily hydrolase (TIGR01509 family)
MPQAKLAILFDFDGVLADTEPLHLACWNQTLAPLGIQITWPLYLERCVGISDREFLEVLGSLSTPPRSVNELWPLYPAKKRLFAERATTGTLVSTETKALLAELRGYPMAVVTSSSRQEIEAILRAEGIYDLFATIVYGDDVKHLKPDPEPYSTAMRRLGVTTAIALEDSNPGKLSARRAGCTLIEIPSAEAMPGLLRQHLSNFR